jgi:uncharacterized protein (TIGR01777 family)
MKKVFVTGASGLVGRRLLDALSARRDTVYALSRYDRPHTQYVRWLYGDPCIPGPWMDEFATCGAVVHLAGEPIMGERWSDEFLSQVRYSRVQSTFALAHELGEGERNKVFVCGSAVGYYGANPGDAVLTEDSPPGPDSDVMASICKEWEAQAEFAKPSGTRVVVLRTGVVLDRAGGALPKMALPFKLFAGGRIGSGKQYLAWIHHADMVGLILYALDNKQMQGTFNATAPIPIRNADFSRELARVLHRPNWLPAPGFMLRRVIGKAAEIALGGQNAVPRKAQEMGYQFKFVTAGAALDDLYQRV